MLTVVAFFYSTLMWDAIAYDVSSLRLTTYKCWMLMLNSSTFFVADMVIPFGRYGLFMWPMWLWLIWFVADMVQTRPHLGSSLKNRPGRVYTISAADHIGHNHIGHMKRPYRPKGIAISATKMYCYLASTFISCQSDTRNVVYAIPSHISWE